MHAYLAISDENRLWINVHRDDIEMSAWRDQIVSNDPLCKVIFNVPKAEVYDTLHGQDAFLDQILDHPWFQEYELCLLSVYPLYYPNKFETLLGRTDKVIRLEAVGV